MKENFLITMHSSLQKILNDTELIIPSSSYMCKTFVWKRIINNQMLVKMHFSEPGLRIVEMIKKNKKQVVGVGWVFSEA